MAAFMKNFPFWLLDLRSGRRHAVPLADAQRLSRAHCASRAYGGRTASFRAYGGHTVPLAPTADARRLFAPTAGTQCLSRLRRAHSAFRAYGVP